MFLGLHYLSFLAHVVCWAQRMHAAAWTRVSMRAGDTLMIVAARLVLRLALGLSFVMVMMFMIVVVAVIMVAVAMVVAMAVVAMVVVAMFVVAMVVLLVVVTAANFGVARHAAIVTFVMMVVRNITFHLYAVDIGNAENVANRQVTSAVETCVDILQVLDCGVVD